ncbi:hypothetical protein [Spiroplasma endosymbiont of Ammophila pubescens]|uniref:hypothetical protein n=1 Tax=Spiroplasma endosymbiont of Ammophila pubescens TaxID=3066315 RepID=UPI0032B219EB
MKKWLSMLDSIGLFTSTISPIVSCVTNENVDKQIRLDIFRNYVKTNSESNNSLKQAKSSDQPFKWYAPKNTEDGSLNVWANDPCTILYDDEGIYYSWILFRNEKDFPAEWVEMTSPDMNSWTQTEIRIKRGREFSQTSYIPSALGG